MSIGPVSSIRLRMSPFEESPVKAFERDYSNPALAPVKTTVYQPSPVREFIAEASAAVDRGDLLLKDGGIDAWA